MIRNILFWGFFPFVMFQAIRLRKNAPRVSGAAGPKVGTVGSGKPYELITIGDSIISGVGASTLASALVGQTAKKLSETLPCRINWAAYGSIGASSNKVLNKLVPNLADTKADFIVLSVGVNDITALSSVSTWTRNLDSILAALHHHSPNAIIAVAGIPPLRGFPLLPQPLRMLFGIRGETFDTACRRVISKHPAAIHVPLEFEPQPEKFSPDGFHPSEESYQEFGEMMARHIVDRLKKNEL
jgi:lysophospholipase L1-like esterase